jgi:hypothetical protein
VEAVSRRRKVIILLSCCLSLLIVSMDATIVNVAIPSIRTELHGSASQLQWVIDVYTLVLASLLLLSGATADRFGRRRVFQIGLMIFAGGSLLCGLAPDMHALIGARLLQGIGGSMLNPVALSIISQVFVGRVERARAIGVWGAVIGIAMALGPMTGGALIELGDWRAVFWIKLADLRRRDSAHRNIRPRVALGHDAGRGPDRSGARRDLPVRHRLRPHPRTGNGLDSRSIRGDTNRRGVGVGGLSPLRNPAQRSVHRPAVLPQHPIRVGDVVVSAE